YCIGRPPLPPLALISSTAISIDGLAPWPHSAPLPVKGTKQPILTVRPSSFAVCAFERGKLMTIATATAAVVSRVLDVIGMILPLLPIAFSDPILVAPSFALSLPTYCTPLWTLGSYRLIPSRFKRRFVPGKFFARQAYSKALVPSL